MSLQEKALRDAMNQYFSVLEIDDANCFGSLGIANVLCEYNKVHEAKEIYKLLSVSEPDSLAGQHAMLNHAHLLMQEANFEFAVSLYQTCLEKAKSSAQRREISMYLAKAHYKKKDFTLCKKLTVNLMVHYPEDLRLKFNLAVCLYKEGNIIFNLNRRKVKQTLYAINNLKQAKSLMRSLLGALRAAGNLGHSAFWSSSSEQMRNQQNYEQVHKNF